MSSPLKYYQFCAAIIYTAIIFLRDDLYMLPLLPLYRFLWIIPVCTVVWTLGSIAMFFRYERLRPICVTAAGILTLAALEIIRRKIFLIFDPTVLTEGVQYLVEVMLESLPLIPLFVAFGWLLFDRPRESHTW